jgi:hypothetical protein
MNSGEADSWIVKAQFGECGSNGFGHFKKFGILDSVEYWEFKGLMFQSIDVQRLALVTGVEIIAGQPAVEC